MVLGWKATVETNVLFLLGRQTHDLHQKQIPGIKATDPAGYFLGRTRNVYEGLYLKPVARLAMKIKTYFFLFFFKTNSTFL